MVKFAQLPKYEAYKDSGVEWLGEIPLDWTVIKMKFLFKDTSIKNMPNEALLSVTQDKGVVPRSWVENRMVMPSGNLESFKYIEKGDFAISLRSFEGGLEYCHHTGIISPAYTVLKTNKTNLVDIYYKYLFKSKVFISELQTSVVGIREGKNISYDELRYSLLPRPPKCEQVLIANFLDQKTTQIDAAIAIKEQQIELLKERKQIIIQQAVTQGLDPNVPMKDSGVEWIGQIPEHWEVVKLSYVAKIDAGSTPSRSNSSYWGGNIPWIKTGEVNYNTIFGSEECITTAGLKGSSLRLAPIGTLLMAMYGQGVTRGRVAVLGIPATYNQACCGITFKSRINVEFARFFFIAAYNYIRDDGNETSQMNLSAGYISSLRIVVPGLDEQSIIIKFLDDFSLSVDEAVSLQVKQIQKIKEYKTTLINSAVTGKIKITPEMLQA